MPQPAVDQSQWNEPVGDDSCRTPNGIESTNRSESAHIDVPHFGIFHDQVQHEVQRLQDGLATVSGAVAELTKTFSQNGKIVKAVGERWGTDQVLEEEIRKLKAENDGIWKHIKKDREKYESKISDLKKKHAEEVSMLQAQADAGEQEKKKFEEMERRRDDQYNKAKQEMDTELKQKKTQLEEENAEEIANLRRETSELEDAKANLEQELKKRTTERDQETQTRVTMQNKLWKDIEVLQNTVSDIMAKYKVDEQPLEF
jgi:chromosome segregation ATPase